MKALSVKQPWAWLIASGRKSIETRLWNTHYRGDLLIVSSKKLDTDNVMENFYEKYGILVTMNLQLGKALCIANLVDCRQMTKEDEEVACCELYDGTWGWVFENVRRIKPFPVKGSLGLYNVQIEDY